MLWLTDLVLLQECKRLRAHSREAEEGRQTQQTTLVRTVRQCASAGGRSNARRWKRWKVVSSAATYIGLDQRPRADSFDGGRRIVVGPGRMNLQVFHRGQRHASASCSLWGLLCDGRSLPSGLGLLVGGCWLCARPSDKVSRVRSGSLSEDCLTKPTAPGPSL